MTLVCFVSGLENNFRKYLVGQASTLGLPYDYDSVMHYSRRAFSKDRRSLDTIVPKDPNARIGQRDGLSKVDVQQLKSLYECKAPSPSRETGSTPTPTATVSGNLFIYLFLRILHIGPKQFVVSNLFWRRECSRNWSKTIAYGDSEIIIYACVATN